MNLVLKACYVVYSAKTQAQLLTAVKYLQLVSRRLERTPHRAGDDYIIDHLYLRLQIKISLSTAATR